MLKAAYHWMGEKVYSKYATFTLAFLFFLEAIFLLIPTDPMLIFYCFERRDKALFYAAVATIGSVLGGITSYFIGFWFADWISAYVLHSWAAEYYTSFCAMYLKYQNWAIFLAGFTPIPYKIATISAGFCKLPLFPFIVLSIASRGARFFLYAGIILTWGEQVKNIVEKYINIIAIGALVLIIGIIWLFSLLR